MITSLYAGILGLIFVVLSFHVVLGRIRNKVNYGDGGLDSMTHRIRIQANFAEYVPLALLMLLLYETQAGSMYMVHALGIVLVIARLLHIFGLHNDALVGRAGGTILTIGVIAVLAVLLIMKGITASQVL